MSGVFFYELNFDGFLLDFQEFREYMFVYFLRCVNIGMSFGFQFLILVELEQYCHKVCMKWRYFGLVLSLIHFKILRHFDVKNLILGFFACIVGIS